MKKGLQPYDARMKAMLTIAVIPLVVLLAQPFGDYSFWVPVLLIGIGTAAHQAWSANIFTTVSDMFPKKAVGSVVGIGGMAGGLGGVLISKSGGALFDHYKALGHIQTGYTIMFAVCAVAYSRIEGLNLVTKYGDKIDLNKAELGSLSKEVTVQLQTIDPTMFDKLLELQKPLVQTQMATAYTIMFAFCALAYLIAWSVMKLLVPKYKAITDL